MAVAATVEKALYVQTRLRPRVMRKKIAHTHVHLGTSRASVALIAIPYLQLSRTRQNKA